MDIYCFYVYAYLRHDGTPYYIGKGKGRRAFSVERTIPKPKNKSHIIFLHKNLTEETAFQLERTYIDLLGRKDIGTGILRNKTDGGEGSSGYKATEKTCAKLSAIAKERPPISEKTRIKLKESAKNRPPISQETREKISAARKGKKHSLETRQKMSSSQEKRVHSEKTKKKISATLKSRYIIA